MAKNCLFTLLSGRVLKELGVPTRQALREYAVRTCQPTVDSVRTEVKNVANKLGYISYRTLRCFFTTQNFQKPGTRGDVKAPGL